MSGANPTVTFVAVDQFGEGVDASANGALSVYASAYVSGIESTTTYASTVSTVAGKAVFTFKNFATAGASAVLKAKLLATKGATTTTETTVNVNVYNSLATDKITVASSFKNDVTYKDFVTGDSADSVVAAKIAKAGIATNVDITGTVLNANNVGQPGVAVEVAIPGALLKAAGVYATDKITAYADEFGNFTVGVASHIANATGAIVTITAEGKTATTLLKSYLPATILTSSTLNFGWSLPAVLVKNTTYVLTATLTDVWGNPVQTSGATGSVSFLGTGAVQVNGVGTAVVKDFDKAGKAVVFVRSVADIAGPGSITATLSAVAAAYATQAGTGTIGTLASVATDVTTTVWNETLFNKELSSSVDILDATPAAAATAAVAGSTGKVYASATNAAGKTVVVKINGKTVKTFTGTLAKKTVVVSSTAGSKTVSVFVGGVRVASKIVTIK